MSESKKHTAEFHGTPEDWDAHTPDKPALKSEFQEKLQDFPRAVQDAFAELPGEMQSALFARKMRAPMSESRRGSLESPEEEQRARKDQWNPDDIRRMPPSKRYLNAKFSLWDMRHCIYRGLRDGKEDQDITAIMDNVWKKSSTLWHKHEPSVLQAVAKEYEQILAGEKDIRGE